MTERERKGLLDDLRRAWADYERDDDGNSWWLLKHLTEAVLKLLEEKENKKE